MVVLRSSVRAMSVPVGAEPVRFLDSAAVSHSSRLISNAAINDADAMSLASKRHDNQLMRDINSRLANAAFAQPATMVKRTALKPPLPPTRLPLSGRVVHSDLGGMRTLTSTMTDDEADRGMVPTPVTARVMRSIRSTSVPPQMPSRTGPVGYSTVGGQEDPLRRYYQTPVLSASAAKLLYGGGQANGRPIDKRFIYDYAQKYQDNNLHKRPHSHLSPSSELAIRQAHRNLDRIERELSFNSNSSAASPPPSPKIYTTHVPDVGPRRRSSSYHGPVASVPRSPSPLRTASYYHHVPSHVTVTDVRRSRPMDLYVTQPAKRITDPSLELLLLEAKSEPAHRGVDGFSAYVWNTEPSVPRFYEGKSEPAHRGVDGFSTYVWNAEPSADISMARPTESIREELNTKLRELSRERPMVSTPVSRPSGPPRTELPTVTRPKVSETRKKVREVLCKVKNDPHYYD